MTLQELAQLAGRPPQAYVLAGLLVGAPALAWLLRMLHGRGGGAGAPWRHVYGLLVYLVCLPGILAATLTGYMLFFTRRDLLQVDVLVYLLPVVSMGITLAVIRGAVSFDDVPGFDRLSGLMVMCAATFALLLAIEKTRIWVFFGGSLWMLAASALALFVLLRWGARRMTRGRDGPPPLGAA